MVDIAVFGSASARIAPERGTAVLRVLATDDERGPAVERAARAHARLVADAQAFVDSGAATRWSADQVVVRTEVEWVSDADRRHRTHVARGGVTVRFADFAALAAWIGDVGERADVEVQGVEWDLTRARLASAARQVRSEAVQDALARAAAYATALGLEDPVVVALHEPGLRAAVAGAGEASHGWTAQALSASSRGRDAEWTLSPQDIEVTAELSLDCTAS